MNRLDKIIGAGSQNCISYVAANLPIFRSKARFCLSPYFILHDGMFFLQCIQSSLWNLEFAEDADAFLRWGWWSSVGFDVGG